MVKFSVGNFGNMIVIIPPVEVPEFLADCLDFFRCLLFFRHFSGNFKVDFRALPKRNPTLQIYGFFRTLRPQKRGVFFENRAFLTDLQQTSFQNKDHHKQCFALKKVQKQQLFGKIFRITKQLYRGKHKNQGIKFGILLQGL